MANDIYNRAWITENAIEIIDRYEPGELTLRALHYQKEIKEYIKTL